MTRFLEITATGTREAGNLICLNSTVQYVFLMRWSGQFTFVVIFPDKLIPICMVNAMLTDVLARGGMEIHRFVPSHRTGCVEMMVNSSMNSRGNGRLTLSRFVLDKSHPRMRHDMWISTFSGSLHSA